MSRAEQDWVFCREFVQMHRSSTENSGVFGASCLNSHLAPTLHAFKAFEQYSRTEMRLPMKPPKSKYTPAHRSWVMSNGDIDVFHVEAHEALEEIGIHLTADQEIDSREFDEAMQEADRDNFPRIFIHKLPTNVLSFSRWSEIVRTKQRA